ncbi:MAG: hypothetical protein N3D11_00585 [Candidatus Sumerlaeia bacterium]|nr:hypothetical protein [Candidatus Sumerlaeia bacterium]
MKRTSAFVAAGALICALAAPLLAQSPVGVQYLTPREVERLSAPAREAYEKGVKALDRVDPITAIQMFDQASQADPAALELAFLTARLAYLRGRIVHGQEAAKYYDIAEKALQRIGKQQDLSPLVKRRYEVQLKTVQDEKSKLEIRDSRRKTVGESFLKIYAQERYSNASKTGEGGEKGVAAAAKRPGLAGMQQPRAAIPGLQPGMQPGMMQPGMQPGMMQPGMQPGMMQPGMMQPGMQPGMMQPGMQPGMMQPGMMQPGMQPGMMQPGMQPGMPMPAGRPPETDS